MNTIPGIIIGLAIGTAVMGLIFLMLPPSTLPAIITTAFSWGIDLLWSFNFILPVYLIWEVVSLMIGLEIVFASVKLFLWIKRTAMDRD